MHRIVVLALEGVIPFELGIAARIFGSAEDSKGRPLYEVLTCTLDGYPVVSDAGFRITVDYSATVLAAADTVVIPPFSTLDVIQAQGQLPQMLTEAIKMIRPGTRIMSICTASYVLAAAGLLDGRPATTHWREAEHLQDTFPLIQVNPDVLFVDDGDLLTSAGAAAGVDLCLHLVRRDHGSVVANQVARNCVVPPWRDGGQAQYIDRPVPALPVASTAAARAWALERLSQPLTLPQLAAYAHMSVRTFTRRFRNEVGMTLSQWLTRQRIDHARHLLESSDMSIELIAAQAGFGSGSSLRQHLRAVLGVSPSAYRRTFQPRSVPAGQ